MVKISCHFNENEHAMFMVKSSSKRRLQKLTRARDRWVLTWISSWSGHWSCRNRLISYAYSTFLYWSSLIIFLWLIRLETFHDGRLLKRIKFILIYIDFQLLLNINFHGLSREFSITLCLLYRVMHSINKSRNFKVKRKKHFDKHHNSNGNTNQSSSYSSKARALARLKPNTSKISMKLKKKLSYLYLSGRYQGCTSLSLRAKNRQIL